MFVIKSSAMIYPRWMLNLLFYFDLWGFCTQFKRSPKQRNFHRLILATHTIVASVATSLIAKYMQRLDGDLSLRAVNDVLKFTVLLLVYWLSIFELYSKRYTQRKFWYIVHYIDKRFCSLQRFDLGKYPSKLQIYFLLSLFVYCIDFKQLFSVEFVSFWLCYLFVVWIYQNRSFYYLFYLEWIKQELKHVVHEANEIVYIYQTSTFQTKNYAMEQFHRNRFKWLRQYFGSIYDLRWDSTMCTMNKDFCKLHTKKIKQNFGYFFKRLYELRLWMVKCDNHSSFGSSDFSRHKPVLLENFKSI